MSKHVGAVHNCAFAGHVQKIKNEKHIAYHLLNILSLYF